MELPGKKSVPFGIDVAREESGFVLYVINGEERIRLDDVQASSGALEARFPGYETVLRARISGDELNGEVDLVHAGGKPLHLPFSARLGETWRFHPEPLTNNADFAGRWSMTFTDGAGRRTAGIADLAQRFERVSGTVQLQAVDQGLLAGEAREEELRLSRFDGAAAILYEAELDANGQLVGTVASDRGGSRRFVAARNTDASSDATALATRLRNPTEHFSFSFRDLDGNVVSSGDPSFKEKVLLVTLDGSWSPNSHDQAGLLVQLDRKYRARGLEIVSLMFEQHPEFEQATQAVRRFRAAHGIGYRTLIAGEADEAKASAALPQLEAVVAYPTAIFIDRAGLVRKVHTGFAGPATGVQQGLLTHEFEMQVDELLAEAPKPKPPGN